MSPSRNRPPAAAENTEHLIRTLAEGLEPVRPMRATTRTALSWAAGLAAVGAGLAVAGTRSDLATRLWETPFLALAAAWALAALGAALATTRSEVPGSRRSAWLSAAAPLAVLVYLAVHAAAEGVGSGIAGPGLGCAENAFVLALVPAVILTVIARRGASTTPVLTGAAIGLFSATLAAGALAFHCPNDLAGHLLMWHALLPMLAWTALGAAWGRWGLRW